MFQCALTTNLEELDAPCRGPWTSYGEVGVGLDLAVTNRLFIGAPSTTRRTIDGMQDPSISRQALAPLLVHGVGDPSDKDGLPVELGNPMKMVAGLDGAVLHNLSFRSLLEARATLQRPAPKPH